MPSSRSFAESSERSGFFRHIMDINPEGVAKVYQAVETLFARLADELKRFQVCNSATVAGLAKVMSDGVACDGTTDIGLLPVATRWATPVSCI